MGLMLVVNAKIIEHWKRERVGRIFWMLWEVIGADDLGYADT